MTFFKIEILNNLKRIFENYLPGIFLHIELFSKSHARWETYCRGNSPQQSLARGTPPEFPLSRPDSIPLHLSVSRIFRKSLKIFFIFFSTDDPQDPVMISKTFLGSVFCLSDSRFSIVLRQAFDHIDKPLICNELQYFRHWLQLKKADYFTDNRTGYFYKSCLGRSDICNDFK